MKMRCETCQYWDFRQPSCGYESKRLIAVLHNGTAIWGRPPAEKNDVACARYEHCDNTDEVKN